MHREEINRLIGKVERAGYTLTPLDLHYSKGRVKLAIGLAKGKKQHDKRATIKEREWNREQQRLLRVAARRPDRAELGVAAAAGHAGTSRDRRRALPLTPLRTAASSVAGNAAYV